MFGHRPTMATSGAPESPVSRYGLTQVYTPAGTPLVDIVFIHGLNGDPHRTWTSDKSQIFWPAQLLPSVLEEEKGRVLVYGYDADVMSFTDGVSKDMIHNHAERLVAELVANRRLRKATERPLIFVAHSLGGLVLKRALIYSSEIRGNNTEHLRSVFVSTYGILFLGVPHRGADLAAWGSRLEWICGAMMPKAVMDTSPQLIEALKKNNETLQNIDRQFIQLTTRFHLYFFHEAKPTILKGVSRYIVDEDSASPNIQDVERASINLDHVHMVKFESDSATGFDLVAEGIQRYAADAPLKISLRWQQEKKERVVKIQAEIDELDPGSIKGTPHSDSTSTRGVTPDTSQLLPPKDSPVPSKTSSKEDFTTTTRFTPPKPTEPYFIVPDGFRANSFFVAMKSEYNELDRLLLFDKRRLDGTACVLLHGQPGGGKSHLARQYVYQNRGKFPGGIFWITAKTKEEMYHSFWNIKQNVVSRDAPELFDGSNDFVRTVKNWFQSRNQWLLVFDGVTIEKNEDATELAKFVPDSQNSSLIYISRARSLESRQRLLRPYPLKVNPLKEEEARQLLFEMLHIKKPTEAQNKKATELVTQIGGLPLGIDMISHRLADTREPLVKFKLSYTANPTLEGTYNKILDDLLRLGHTGAWNLINILCWFGQNIPVEMVHMGSKILKAEKVEVKSSQSGGEPDINNTIFILMRYALIERNEPEPEKDSSSSRDSLVDPEPIDMLRIHSVVQNFCCSSLNSRNMLPEWLGYAVKLFDCSYYQADVRMKQKPERGRVSDYRYYLVHGQRLWDHAVSYSRKSQPLRDISHRLRQILDRINIEIQLREPSSSQESIKTGIFQVSIFDRTSSSSDSGPSIPGPPTPKDQPPLPPLGNTTIYGLPKDHEMDSPNSVESLRNTSPHAVLRNLGYSPGNRSLGIDDAGYDSDREHPGPHVKKPKSSDGTSRAPSRSRAETSESHNEGWTLVSSNRNARNQRGHRDLGSFRPTPARVSNRLDRTSAMSPLNQVNRSAERRGSSPALEALHRVHSHSPSPPPSRKGLQNIFPFSSLGRPSSQPTWAGIAAGRTAPPGSPIPPPPNSVPTPHTTSPSVPPFIECGRVPSGLNIGLGSVQSSTDVINSNFAESAVVRDPSSTTVAEIRPSQPYPDPRNEYQAIYPPNQLQYQNAEPGSNSSLSRYLPQYPALQAPTLIHPQQPDMGPNHPTPLLVEEDITITSKRRLPADFSTTYQQQPAPAATTPSPRYPSPQTQPPSRTSPIPLYSPNVPPPPLPAGYSSQPMSRDHSHTSHISIETAPLPYPPTFFSPTPSPINYPATAPLRNPQTFITPQQQQNPTPYYTFPDDHSPRERAPNGRPPRKSPKTDFAFPVLPIPTTISPYSSSTLPVIATTPTLSTLPNSGPGIAIPTDNSHSPNNHGLGIIAFSENVGREHQQQQHVQFGELSPVRIEDARQRTREYEGRLREMGYVGGGSEVEEMGEGGAGAGFGEGGGREGDAVRGRARALSAGAVEMGGGRVGGSMAMDKGMETGMGDVLVGVGGAGYVRPLPPPYPDVDFIS